MSIVKNIIANFKKLPISTKRLLGIGLTFAFVLALPLFIWGILTQRFDVREKAQVIRENISVSGEPAKGSDSFPAPIPVTIVMYSDFQCPDCKSFIDNTLPAIMAAYPIQLKFVFKDFPLTSTHPLAQSAAIAGQCAFAQNKFWEMHDLIFAKQDTLVGTDFANFATQLNLNMTQFNVCLTNQAIIDEVNADLAEGQALNITETPTFFINGIRVDGNQPLNVFVSIIDAEITPVVTSSPTESPTEQPTEAPTDAPTEAPTESPTEQPTEAPTDAPTALAGDVNLDGVVNITDLQLVVAHYDEVNPNYADMDLDQNNDGVVNIVDLGIVISNYY